MCRYNGIFKIIGYEENGDKNIIDETNDDIVESYFDNVSAENNRNLNNGRRFFHQIDLRATVNLNNEDRFSWQAPTISQVSPSSGPVEGGQEIKIGGFNFGDSTQSILDITVRGVLCYDFVLLSPNLLSCVTRPSIILGAGLGVVKVRLKNGLKSPFKVCNVYDYRETVKRVEDVAAERVEKIVRDMDLPIYNNAHYYDNGLTVTDPLVLRRMKLPFGAAPVTINKYEVERKKTDESEGPSVVGGSFRKNRFDSIVANLVSPA